MSVNVIVTFREAGQCMVIAWCLSAFLLQLAIVEMYPPSLSLMSQVYIVIGFQLLGVQLSPIFFPPSVDRWELNRLAQLLDSLNLSDVI